MANALYSGMTQFIVRYSYHRGGLRGGLRTVSFVRAEYAPNKRADATRFDTREEAENAADIVRENIRGYALSPKVDIIQWPSKGYGY